MYYDYLLCIYLIHVDKERNLLKFTTEQNQHDQPEIHFSGKLFASGAKGPLHELLVFFLCNVQHNSCIYNQILSEFFSVQLHSSIRPQNSHRNRKKTE